MDVVTLGSTDVQVSKIALGTVKFGRNQGVKYPQGFDLPDEAYLSEFLALAKSLGITTLDTAPAYGLSEERLGRLLEGQRKDWTIIGKVGEEFEHGASEYIFTADHFKRSLERSLKRLKTDFIDGLLIHSDGRDADILSDDSLIRTLHDFKDQGLIKAHGASTKTVEGGKMAIDKLDCAMVMYNPVETAEEPVIDYALEKGKGILLKKVFASGHVDKIPGENPVQESLRFVFKHAGVHSAVIGTISEKNLRANVEAYNKILL